MTSRRRLAGCVLIGAALLFCLAALALMGAAVDPLTTAPSSAQGDRP